jgi:hypothetical protein
MQVGKIAPAAAGNQDFLSQSLGMVQHRNPAASLAGFHGAHQSGRAAADNECIEAMDHGWLLVRYM